MVRKVAETRPLSFEDTGVIGVDSVPSDVQAPLSDGEARAAARPADAAVPEGLEGHRPADFEREAPPEAAKEYVLPDGFEDWEGFKLANGSARDSFAFVIRFPGTVFRASGRYHNAQKVDEFYDVVDGQIVPDGLYLIPTNYLVNRATASGILSGKRAPERATQPDPLRPVKSKE